MALPNGIERRDPVSGLLHLGGALAKAGLFNLTGEIRVTARERHYAVRVIQGIVSEVVRHESVPAIESRDAVHTRAAALFDLPRPLVAFDENASATGRLLAVYPEQVVVAGVLRRQDLFDPRPLLDRIPVTILRLKDDGVNRLRGVGLAAEEHAFIQALRTPTPATLALWKRGLSPRHAAALVMALNLLDCFDDWQAGDLPRRNATVEVRRRIAMSTSDLAVLGLDSDADDRAVDRAFRKLSYKLHPDRLRALPADEQRRAAEAFQAVTEAHGRLTQSRRARRVHHVDAADDEVRVVRSKESWRIFFEKTTAAARAGRRFEARAYAVKALAASPPPEVAQTLKHLIRSVA